MSFPLHLFAVPAYFDCMFFFQVNVGFYLGAFASILGAISLLFWVILGFNGPPTSPSCVLSLRVLFLSNLKMKISDS